MSVLNVRIWYAKAYYPCGEGVYVLGYRISHAVNVVSMNEWT